MKPWRDPELHHLTRLDYRRMHGWWARIQRGGKRKVVLTSRFFSDFRWGGEEEALEEAKAWRDRELPRHPRPYLHQSNQKKPAGAAYVYRSERRGVNGPLAFWAAVLRREGGRRVWTTYSIGLWGERGAREKCLEWVRKERRGLDLRARARRARARALERLARLARGRRR